MPIEETKIDKGVELTFPASDPPAVGTPTGTEAARRPIDRTAPLITKEDVDAASLPEALSERRTRHHGLGTEGLEPSDNVAPPADEQGLGREGCAKDN